MCGEDNQRIISKALWLSGAILFPYFRRKRVATVNGAVKSTLCGRLHWLGLSFLSRLWTCHIENQGIHPQVNTTELS